MSTLKTSLNGKDSEVKITTDQLVETLRSLWELMEYYIWYPTLDTANAVKNEDATLLKEKITGAIAKRNLQAEVVSAIKTQLDYWQDRKISEPYTMDDTWIKWTYNGVPVELKILKRRYKFFENPDPVNFNFDDYKLGNPWLTYWKSRFIIQ